MCHAVRNVRAAAVCLQALAARARGARAGPAPARPAPRRARGRSPTLAALGLQGAAARTFKAQLENRKGRDVR